MTPGHELLLFRMGGQCPQFFRMSMDYQLEGHLKTARQNAIPRCAHYQLTSPAFADAPHWSVLLGDLE